MKGERNEQKYLKNCLYVAVRAYGGLEIQLLSFLTFVLGSGNWTDGSPRRFYPK